MSHLLCERDHPRLVQGNIDVSRGWGCNVDLQFVVAMQRDTDDLNGTNVLDFIIGEVKRMNALSEAERVQEQALWNSRGYFNKGDYVETLIDYCVAYACKGEISSTEAVAMFKEIMKSRLDNSTAIGSVCQRLNLKVLKSKDTPRSESVFFCLGCPVTNPLRDLCL